MNRIRCSLCPDASSQKDILEIHKSCYINEEFFIRSTCLKRSRRKKDLETDETPCREDGRSDENTFHCLPNQSMLRKEIYGTKLYSSDLNTFCGSQYQVSGKSVDQKTDFQQHIGSHEIRTTKLLLYVNDSEAPKRSGELETPELFYAVENFLPCTELDETFSQKKDLERHERVQTSENLYLCSTCGETFSQKRDFKEHKRVHMRNNSYLCSTCGETFSQKRDFEEHKRVHMSENLYLCFTCGETFSQERDFEEHNRSHMKNNSYFCSTCEEKFSQERDFEEHKRVHMSENSCLHSKCRGTCSQKRDFEEHKRVHMSENSCLHSKCRGTCSQKRNFKEHQPYLPPKQPHSCNYCPQSFSQLDDCMRHMSLQHFFGCDICGKFFNQKYKLETHIRNDHSYGSEVQVCGNKRNERQKYHGGTILYLYHTRKHSSQSSQSNIQHVYNPSQLGTITRNQKSLVCSASTKSFGPKNEDSSTRTCSHTNNSNKKTFIERDDDSTDSDWRIHYCSMCPENFATKKDLTDHVMQNHKVAKSICCLICSKTFSQRNQLTDHMNAHGFDKVFECQRCEKIFPFERCLIDHMIYFHKIPKKDTCFGQP
ncbi:zinc finger protein 845-like [Copidosoma floridanum]|uniref:zinc finger protein 845-like n=1 Tax=Copidosoma floridanum TaxID=29053 RepID=UPI0006C9C9DC|nr:zinc finger protein 845-like [Copidosoma floridanum]